MFYFSSVAPGRTKITIVGLGYGDDDASRSMRGFFRVANAQLIEKLDRVLRGAGEPGEG